MPDPTPAALATADAVTVSRQLLVDVMQLLGETARGDKLPPYRYGEAEALLEHALGLTEPWPETLSPPAESPAQRPAPEAADLPTIDGRTPVIHEFNAKEYYILFAEDGGPNGYSNEFLTHDGKWERNWGLGSSARFFWTSREAAEAFLCSLAAAPPQPASPQKTIVSFEEVEAIRARRQEINAIPFSEIEWTRGGKPLVLTPDEIESWRFVGMSNVAFIEFYEGGIPTITVQRKG